MRRSFEVVEEVDMAGGRMMYRPTRVDVPYPYG